MAITDWPLQERPRERLIALGPRALADAELLAILLRTGVEGQERGGRRARRCSRASARSPPCSTPRPASSPRCRAWGARSRRSCRRRSSSRAAPCARSLPRATRSLRRARCATTCVSPSPGASTRSSSCLLLDAQHRVIACEDLFRGTLTQTSVYPREVVKCAPAAQRRRGDLRAQSPSGRGRAQPRGRDRSRARSSRRWGWSTCRCSIISWSPGRPRPRSPSAGCCNRLKDA